MKLLHPFSLSMAAAAIGTIAVLWMNYPTIDDQIVWLSMYVALLCGIIGGVAVLSRENWRAYWFKVCQSVFANNKKAPFLVPLILTGIGLLPAFFMFDDADTAHHGMRGYLVDQLIGVHRSIWPDALVKLPIYGALLGAIAAFFVTHTSIYFYLMLKRK